MPAAFVDQRTRVRRIVEKALAGTDYESAALDETARLLTLRARRRDGRVSVLRFRGVRRSETDAAVRPGSPLVCRSVASAAPLALLRLLFPLLPRAGSDALRVKIDAGAARLEVVCEDAEWWEEDASPPATSRQEGS